MIEPYFFEKDNDKTVTVNSAHCGRMITKAATICSVKYIRSEELAPITAGRFFSVSHIKPSLPFCIKTEDYQIRASQLFLKSLLAGTIIAGIYFNPNQHLGVLGRKYSP